MTVRVRLAIATGLIVLVTLGAFELSFYADLLSSDEDPGVVAMVTRHAGRAAVLGAIAAAAAFAAAWVAGARALQPLTSIVSTAAQLAAGGDFSRRLATNRRDPEVAHLIHTFNDLVARVENVLTAQR